MARFQGRRVVVSATPAGFGLSARASRGILWTQQRKPPPTHPMTRRDPGPVRSLDAFARLTGELIVVVDAQGEILALSEPARDWLGEGAAQLVGCRLDSIVEPTSLERFGAFVDAVPSGTVLASPALSLAGAAGFEEVELTGLRPAGCDEVVLRIERAALPPALDPGLELTRRALEAQEEERRRLAQELHDDLGQLLTAVRLELDIVRLGMKGRPLEPGAFDPAYALLGRIHESIRRLCRGLRPPVLERLGLVPALQQVVDAVEERTTMAIESEFVVTEGASDPPEAIALCVFRTLQEAINNALKHASATGLWVSLFEQTGELVLSVYDDGVGLTEEARDKGGVGLDGLRERAQLCGGSLLLESRRGEGTRLTLRVPIE